MNLNIYQLHVKVMVRRNCMQSSIKKTQNQNAKNSTDPKPEVIIIRPQAVQELLQLVGKVYRLQILMRQ